MRPVPNGQVPGLYQNQAPFTAKGLMLAEMGTANPATLRVVPIFVRKDPLHHEYFFTTVMAMGIEKSARRPAHHGSVLRAELGQWQYLQTRD